MRRTGLTVAAGVLVTLVLCAAGAGTALEAAAALVGPPVPRSSRATVADGPDQAAVVGVPAGTSVLALFDGRPEVEAPGTVKLTGRLDGDQAVARYTGVTPAAVVTAQPSAGEAAPQPPTSTPSPSSSASPPTATPPPAPSASPSRASPPATTPPSRPVPSPPAHPVRRGDVLATVPAGPSAGFSVALWLDGTPLDAAPLLSAALDGVPALMGAFLPPVRGAVVTQGFGCTPYAMEPVDRACPQGHFHSGIDLACPAGTPVHATLAGTAHVVDDAGGYGLHVVIDHGDGLSSLYGHLSAVAVTDGEVVAAGDLVGAVGSTGNSTGPHLHFEIRRDRVAEDPRLDVALP